MLGEIRRAEKAVLVLINSLEDGFRFWPFLKTDLAVAAVIFWKTLLYRDPGLVQKGRTMNGQLPH